MPNAPTLQEVLQQVFDENSARLRAIEPGEVVSWDRSEQFATIQPLVRDRAGEARAQIHKVPVIQPTAYHDVQVGETGLLLVCDRDPSKWWRDGTESDPETAATHSVSNSIFIPGLRSSGDARTIPADTAVLEKPKAGGEVHLGVQGATRFVVHDALTTTLNAFLTALNTWGTTAHADWATAAGAFSAVTTTITNLKNADYISSSVKVED